MIKLSERAVLVALHMGTWSGYMFDDEVTTDVSQRAKADKKVGRYNKLLVDKTLLRGVGSAVSLARTTHSTLTLPWSDDARILSTAAHPHYSSQMRDRRINLEQERDEMLKLYPAHISSLQNKDRLGKLYNADDFPTVEELRDRFYIDVEIKQMPDTADFRAKLSDASVKAVIKDIERRGDQRVKTALNDVFRRVADHTEKMVERLRIYQPAEGSGRAGNIFKDSLVYNLKELAELLPILNVTDDPRISKLQQQITDELIANSPEVLRVNDKVRLATADKAEEIYKRVSAYLA